MHSKWSGLIGLRPMPSGHTAQQQCHHHTEMTSQRRFYVGGGGGYLSLIWKLVCLQVHLPEDYEPNDIFVHD